MNETKSNFDSEIKVFDVLDEMMKLKLTRK